MSILPKSLQRLIEEFTKLPGVGPKTASRFAFNILTWSEEDIRSLSEAIQALEEGIDLCPNCYTMSESGLCEICRSSSRDKKIVAVVERPLDVIALEATRDYNGLYHVLGGVIAPLDGTGPQNLKIDELIARIKKNSTEEVILATNPNLEGETTAMYVAKQLKSLPVKITRIARGLPIGGELEYADEGTLTSALEGRRDYGK